MSCQPQGKGWWVPAEFDENGIRQGDNRWWLDDKEVRFNDTDCIFGNGDKHAIITINGKSPPPPIEVQEGAMLHVKVSLTFLSLITLKRSTII